MGKCSEKSAGETFTPITLSERNTEVQIPSIQFLISFQPIFCSSKEDLKTDPCDDMIWGF